MLIILLGVFRMSDPKNGATRNYVRVALSLLLVGLYVAGLIAMIAGSFQAGLHLWVISTLGGIGLLYWIRTMERRREDAEKIAKGMPYGDPDDPTAEVTPVVPEDEAQAPGEDDARCGCAASPGRRSSLASVRG